MLQNPLEQLRGCTNKIVNLTLTDGETCRVRVVWVSDEYQEVTVDILSTDRPERYAQMGKSPSNCAWTIAFAEIADVNLTSTSEQS